MNVQEIAALRLLNQCIGGSALTAREIVLHMGAMQAQDYAGALWSIGLRTGLTEMEVVQAIKNRDIVRTWPQRGTLHFVPAKDAKWQVGLSVERLIRAAGTRHAGLELNEQILAKSKNVLSKALRGGTVLPRAMIMETLEQSGIRTHDGRGYHILWYLSQTGVLVAGPMDGKQQTFVLLDEWVKKSEEKTRESGIATLAKRYFISHGPATLRDFMWWSGLTSADAKAGLASNAAILSSEQVDGREYWMKKGSKIASGARRGYLLPGFDEYLLGYQDRSAVLSPEYAKKIVPGGNGMFLSTIVIDGQVVGTWKKEVKKDRVIIRLDSFQKLSNADRKLLEAAATQFGRFLGRTAEIA